MTARRVLVALLALLALGLSGCVSLPREGAVRSVTAEDQADTDTLVDYTPGGPKKGSEPVPLVDNWLKAMTATPLNTSVARQFLTSESRPGWVPERGTLVYGSHSLTGLPGHKVRLHLSDVAALDDRGTWLGDPTGGQGMDVDMSMVKDNGEWRISRPPNRLVIAAATVGGVDAAARHRG